MGLSIRSPGGYSAATAYFRSDPIANFPADFGLSFWLSGQVPSTPLYQTNTQRAYPAFNSRAGGARNYMPLIWFGDALCNVADNTLIDPNVSAAFQPNYSWAVLIKRFPNLFDDAQIDYDVSMIVPSSDELAQNLLFQTYESDLYYAQSYSERAINNIYNDYGWNYNAPNHIYFDFRRIRIGYDWGLRISAVVNGFIQTTQLSRSVPILDGAARLNIGAPVIPLGANDEVIVEDIRVYDLTGTVPPMDATPGASWNFSQPWAFPQELAYSRGRDRLGVPLFAHVPFENVDNGAAYTNGFTFYDTTNRVKFTTVTSGSLLSQVPVSARSSLGRGRNMAPTRLQMVDVSFQGGTSSYNETTALEGTLCEGTTFRYFPSLHGLANGETALAGSDTWAPVLRRDPVTFISACNITLE